MSRGDGSNWRLGQRLKEARLVSGMTQRQAAEAIGVDPNTIYSYEANRVNPSGPALHALSAVYGKSVEWLYGIEDDLPASRSWLGNRMMTLYTLGDRLREARLEKGLTLEQAAERVGVRLNTVWSYEKNKFQPSEPVLRLCAQIYDKPVEWFFGEEEEPQAPSVRPGEALDTTPHAGSSGSDVVSLAEVQRDFSARFDKLESYMRTQAPAQAIAESRTGYGPSHYDPSDRSPVRLLEVASAAGVGAEVYDETPVGLLWFRNDWLQSHSIDPEQSNIISVRGESMEPTLPDGCSILVDRKRRDPHEDRIYVMRTEEGLVVKRASKDEDGRWQIVSDHPAWETMPWADDTEIIGEVRWAARTF